MAQGAGDLVGHIRDVARSCWRLGRWAWYFDPTRVTASAADMTDWEVGSPWMLPEQFLFLAATPPIAMLVIGLAWVAASFRRA